MRYAAARPTALRIEHIPTKIDNLVISQATSTRRGPWTCLPTPPLRSDHRPGLDRGPGLEGNDLADAAPGLLKGSNRHLKFSEVTRKGYVLVDPAREFRRSGTSSVTIERAPRPKSSERRSPARQGRLTSSRARCRQPRDRTRPPGWRSGDPPSPRSASHCGPTRSWGTLGRSWSSWAEGPPRGLAAGRRVHADGRSEDDSDSPTSAGRS